MKKSPVQFVATLATTLFLFGIFSVFVACAAQDAVPSSPTDAWRPGAGADAVPKPSLPDWATSQIDAAFSRFQAWKGSDVTFVFPTITDVHSTSLELSDPIDWSDSKSHAFLLKAVAKKFGADFIADLGDMGLDSPPTKDRSAALKRMATNTLLYSDAPVPALFALGNHDHNRKGDFISSQEFGATFTAESKRRGLAMTTGPNEDYGYVDFPNKRCRVIFLNTSDDGYYGYSTAQLQFLADALASTPRDYTASIIEHFCVYFDLGCWTNDLDAKAKRDGLCMKIFAAFVAGTNGEEENVVWKFAERGPGSLSGVYHGDSHFDNQKTIDGVPYFITQGFGGCDPTVMPSGAVKRDFDRAATTLIDVVAIKPAKRETKVFRVGIGDADADRGWTF